MHITDQKRKLVEKICIICNTYFDCRPDRDRKTCSKECLSKYRWRNRSEGQETYKHTSGYIWQKVPDDHPHGQYLGGKRKTKNKYIFQHRYIFEQKLNRYLEPHERVHHKNGIRDDNRIENLELWTLPRKDPPGQRMDDLMEELRNSISFLDEREIDEVVRSIKTIFKL